MPVETPGHGEGGEVVGNAVAVVEGIGDEGNWAGENYSVGGRPWAEEAARVDVGGVGGVRGGYLDQSGF